AVHSLLLLRRRQRWSLLRVETEGHHAELLAGIEGDGAEAAGDTLEYLIAEHRAAIIHGRQDHGLARKGISQADRAPGLVAKCCIEWNRGVELGIEANLAQQRRQAVRCGGLSDQRGGRQQRQQNPENSPTRDQRICRSVARATSLRMLHGRFSRIVLRGGVEASRDEPSLLGCTPGLPRPRSATSFMASSMGILARPAFSSTQA